ncbi:MAG: glycogen/starch synthase [Bacteroidales bacterium]|nr:glycogen/starch synthase [Bacteroidales bacterium]
MEKPRVLFVQQEITPYLKDSPMGLLGRHLPQGIQEKGKEIRTFMPRFGCINERRNQLHEVIRLSGMNLIINDTDHPLIIKVASIQSARMQIYFIDNEDFFQRKFTTVDKNGKYFSDNDERSIFFCRGVLETVKKLQWSPDIVHCNGWMTNVMPLFLRTAYKDNPMFTDTKIVYSVYDDDFPEKLPDDYFNKIKMEGIEDSHLEAFRDPSYVNISKAAISLADGIVIGSEKINPEIQEFIMKSGKPVLQFPGNENYTDAYNDFYDEVLVSENVMSE